MVTCIFSWRQVTFNNFTLIISVYSSWILLLLACPSFFALFGLCRRPHLVCFAVPRPKSHIMHSMSAYIWSQRQMINNNSTSIIFNIIQLILLSRTCPSFFALFDIFNDFAENVWFCWVNLTICMKMYGFAQ